MSKRYDEPIGVEATDGALEAFTWRGKRYRVRRVLARWREAGGWWNAPPGSGKPWQTGTTREIVRVEAQHERARLAGTYEIALDLRAGAWRLFRVLD